ncbi:hypothetical protein ES703_115337 [subsurface metagenome]
MSKTMTLPGKDELISFLKKRGLIYQDNQTDEQSEYFLERVCENTKECLLCAGKPYTLGIFVPDDSLRWGAIKGKQRIFFYSLCQKCLKLKGAAVMVENKISEFFLRKEGGS